jgi:hypothetical protein
MDRDEIRQRTKIAIAEWCGLGPERIHVDEALDVLRSGDRLLLRQRINSQFAGESGFPIASVVWSLRTLDTVGDVLDFVAERLRTTVRDPLAIKGIARTRVIDSPHLIAYEALPSVDPLLSVAEAFQRLARTGRSGFSIGMAGQRYFVKGNELLERLLVDADREQVPRLMSQPLWELIQQPSAASTRVPVEMIGPGDELGPLMQRDQSARALLVRDDRHQLGWLFNKHSLLNPATKRPNYICGRGHSNTDPDHGTCYQCPAKIVRVELE